MLGTVFEREIGEQPAVWEQLAASDAAQRFADAVGRHDVVFVGSGSSLFVAQLGALAFRRRGIRAVALPATEARFDGGAYRDACVVALSQSGRSADLLDAIAILRPRRLLALTNDAASPLAQQAETVIDAGAGPEHAVPASKSVTAMAAIVLWAAALTGGAQNRTAATLRETAAGVRAWLASAETSTVDEAAATIAACRSVVIVGAGYGVPIANELALKIKEASYLHAEGFAAGEFRHGSSAILDASCAIIGIVDEASRAIVDRPLAEAAQAHAARYTIGARSDGVTLLGPVIGEAFNTLAWLTVGQRLALALGRARNVESDAPRGLRKFVP